MPIGDTLSLVGGILPPCGIASTSISGSSLSKVDEYTYTVVGSGASTLFITSDTGTHSYTLTVNGGNGEPPAYPANVGPNAQGPACPWGGHLNEQGDLCVGSDPPPTPIPTPTPTPTVDPYAPVQVTPTPAASADPRARWRLTPDQIRFTRLPGEEAVAVTDERGHPLQILSMTDESGMFAVTDEGTDFLTRPSNWQAQGYGDICWSYSGFGGATGVILPVAKPPFRTLVADWELDTAILGTATGNIVFTDVRPGDTVSAGSRAIETVTICARSAAASESSAPETSPMTRSVPSIGWPERFARTGCPDGSFCQKNGNNCQRNQNPGHPYEARYGVCAPPSFWTSGRISICRATGNPQRPYVQARIAVSSISSLPRNAIYPQGGWTDVIPGYGTYPGQNWPVGMWTFNNGCQVPEYTSTKSASGTVEYCLNGVTATSPYVSSATVTSNVSQADANARAQAAAQAGVSEAKATAIPAGATAGACTVFTSKPQTVAIPVTYCSTRGIEETQTITGTSGPQTSTISQKDADAKANTAAFNDVLSVIDILKRSGATIGKCPVYTSTKRVSGTFDFCAGSTSGSFPYSGSATATSTVSQAEADREAADQALANAVVDVNAKLPPGATQGNCTSFTSARTVGGRVTYCAAGVAGTFDYSGSGSATSAVSQPDADSQAQASATAAANTAKQDRLTQLGATEGSCPTYSSTLRVGSTIAYCANGTQGSASIEGTGSATSTMSQANADAQAQAAATADLARAKSAALPANATEGACPTPTPSPTPTITVTPAPQVTISGTGQVTVATAPPVTLTGCGSQQVYPWPPDVPVPLFGNCVPTPYPTPTPTTASPTPFPTPPSPPPYATPTAVPSSPYATPTPTGPSASPSTQQPSASPTASTGTSPPLRLKVPTQAPGGGTPTLTLTGSVTPPTSAPSNTSSSTPSNSSSAVPSTASASSTASGSASSSASSTAPSSTTPSSTTPSTPSSTPEPSISAAQVGGSVTLTLTNGPATTTVSVPAARLAALATGESDSGSITGASSSGDSGSPGLADTGASRAAGITIALVLLGLGLILAPAVGRRRERA